MGTSVVIRVIEQCFFNIILDPFNIQTVNFILKPPKVIESRTYVKQGDLEHYLNNTVHSLLLNYFANIGILFSLGCHF